MSGTITVLSDETAARVAADATLLANIGSTTGSVTTEAGARASADGTIATNLAAAIAAATAEANARALADTTLLGSLTAAQTLAAAETAARIASDNTLNNNLALVLPTASIGTLTAGLAAEITSRTAADTANALAITTEAANRQTGDLALLTSVNSLTTSLTAETNQRTAADQTLSTGLAVATANLANLQFTTVINGVQSPATITGAAPNFTMSFTLPAQAAGPPGPTSAAPFSGFYDAAANNPPLAAGGVGAAPGTCLLVSTSGTRSFDKLGTLTAGQTIINVSTSGSTSQWFAAPVLGFGGTLSALMLPNYTMLDDGSGVMGFGWQESSGAQHMSLAPTANGWLLSVESASVRDTLTVGTVNATVFNGPAISITDTRANVLFAGDAPNSRINVAGGRVEVGNTDFFAVVNDVDRQNLFTVSKDGDANVARGLHVYGNLTVDGTVGSTGFSTADIASMNHLAIGYASEVQGSINTTSQRPVMGYNIMLEQGESHVSNNESYPPISVTPPTWSSSLMYGQATKANTNSGTATGIGDNLLHPLKSVAVTGGNAIATAPRSGTLAGLNNCSMTGTFTGSNRTGTFVSAGINFPATFSVGDALQMKGCTVATANNVGPLYNGQRLIVTSSAVGTLVMTDAGGNIVAINNESGIQLSIVAFGNAITGEDQIVRATWGTEAALLDARGLASDTTRVLVSSNTACGVGPTTYYAQGTARYSAVVSTAVNIKALANTASKTACLWNYYLQGGAADSGNATPYAQLLPQLQAHHDAIQADIATGVFAQGRPAWFTGTVVSGRQLRDTVDVNGVINSTLAAQLDFYGLRPALGNDRPYSPNCICVGADHWVTDHGIEPTSNAQQIWGDIRAEAHASMLNEGYFKPTHAVQAIYRGAQVLVAFYAPVAPITIMPSYTCTYPWIPTDLGITIVDSNGTVTVTGYTVLPPYVIQLNTSRIVGSTPSPIISASRSGTVLTVACAAIPAGVVVGQWMTLAGITGDTTMNGIKTVTAIAGTGPYTITCNEVLTFGALPGPTPSVGTVAGATARMSEIIKVADAGGTNGYNGAPLNTPHGGVTPIADSRKVTSRTGAVYTYTGDNSGASLGDNLPNVPVAPAYLQNNKPVLLPNYSVPTVFPMSAG